MGDDETKSQEEAYLSEHYGGGMLGVSGEQVHDFVHQNDTPTEQVNDIHTSAAHDEPEHSAAAYGAEAFEAVTTGMELAEGNPMAVAETAAHLTQAVMEPHAQEVAQRLGEYGGTSPDGGLPSETGSGSE